MWIPHWMGFPLPRINAGRIRPMIRWRYGWLDVGRHWRWERFIKEDFFYCLNCAHPCHRLSPHRLQCWSWWQCQLILSHWLQGVNCILPHGTLEKTNSTINCGWIVISELKILQPLTQYLRPGRCILYLLFVFGRYTRAYNCESSKTFFVHIWSFIKTVSIYRD